MTTLFLILLALLVLGGIAYLLMKSGKSIIHLLLLLQVMIQWDLSTGMTTM